MLKSLKKIVSILTWPCILIISQVFIAFISFITTNIFIIDVKTYLFNEIYILLTIFFNIIVLIIPIYIKKIKGTKIKKLKIKDIIYIILITILFSVIWNLIFRVTERKVFSLSYMLSTCLIGPILEEIIYRKLVLEKVNKNKYIITTFIFAISHFNLYKIFSSFCAGSLFYYFLTRYKSIYASVLAHITYNTICYLFMIFVI